MALNCIEWRLVRLPKLTIEWIVLLKNLKPKETDKIGDIEIKKSDGTFTSTDQERNHTLFHAVALVTAQFGVILIAGQKWRIKIISTR